MSAPRTPDGVDLAWLLEGLVVAPRLRVAGITQDSRAVAPGDAFVAVQGLRVHGLEHAEAAIARGARVLLWDPGDDRELPALPASVLAVAVPRLRARLGLIADRCYGEPSAQAAVTGITGTNGKTTCAWLLAQAHGARGAYAGTLGYGRPPQLAQSTHTTPDVLSVHRWLRELCDAGARHVAMEVSSHALDQERIAGVRVRVAGFTNLSRDHLDYHGTMGAYGSAKERLFSIDSVAHAVVNVGDAFGRELVARLPARVALTAVCAQSSARAHAVARAADAARWVEASAVRCVASGLDLEGSTHAGPFRLRSPLIGEFNAENLLLVLGLLLAEGVRLADALAALAAASAPPGRMESFRLANGSTLVVDYAHTPDALDKALAAARRHASGRVWCVFGCGGDRDPGKRPQMAAAAEARADVLVITDDNPRTEDPDRIVAMIRAGLQGRVPTHVERDRAAAIRFAAESAHSGDVVLVAGKGHEDYQIVGTDRRAFSDRALAAELAGGGR